MKRWYSMTDSLNTGGDHDMNGITKNSKVRAPGKPFQTLRIGGKKMKGIKILISFLAIGFLATACVSDGQNTQRGAVLGGILGAVAGQAIGHNTAGTLIGAGAGALTGAIIGNTHDQQQLERRIESGYPDRQYDRSYERPYASTPQPDSYQGSLQGQYPEPPPGQWVDVPGQWVNGKWVPSHKVWVPVNPGSSYRR